MAKISARGATKVESIASVIHYSNVHSLDDGGTLVVKYTHTLCSDGRVLRKTDLDGYRVVAKIKSHVPDPVKTFRAYVRRFEEARS